MYKLIESSCIGKINQTKCEDGYFVSDKIIAVVDGGSPKGNKLWQHDKTSGWYAKELILRSLEKVDPNWTNRKILDFINNHLTQAYENQDAYFYDHPEEQLQAGIIFYNDLRHEIVSYGDCPLLINNDYYDHAKFVDVISTGLRSFYLNLNDLGAIKPKETDIETYGRSIIIDILKKQGFFSNLERPFGFPVLNGLKLNHKLTIVHQVKPQDQIVLASDGYIKLFLTLKKSEKHLFKILRQDPDCYREFLATKGLKPKMKSFDDRTYVRLKITN